MKFNSMDLNKLWILVDDKIETAKFNYIGIEISKTVLLGKYRKV